MDNQNYILITGWMVNELNLKGSELFVYALIYGFSQDGESKFYGSRRYIAEWFNCSLPTIDKALNGLLEKDLIIKDEEIINGVKFNRYKYNKKTLGDIKNLYRGDKETLYPYKETLYNNNKYNNNNNIDIYNYYENIFGRTLNSIEYETMTNWLKDKSEEEIKNAINETAKSNIDNIKYVSKVLYSNKKRGVIPEWLNKEIVSTESDSSDEDFKKFLDDFRK